MDYADKWTKFAKRMTVNKYIKAGILCIAIIAAGGFALSRISFNNTVKAAVSKTLLNTEARIGSGSQDNESDLDEGSSPAYFNIFRFISNLVPSSN